MRPSGDETNVIICPVSQIEHKNKQPNKKPKNNNNKNNQKLGMDIEETTTTHSNNKARELLREFQFPFTTAQAA